MPTYKSGGKRPPEQTDKAPDLRVLPDPCATVPETFEERREQLIELFESLPQMQTIKDILKGLEPPFIEHEDAENLADLVEIEKPEFDSKLFDAVNTCREAGIIFKEDEETSRADPPAKAAPNPFGNPRRLDFLLGYDIENDPNNVIGKRWICRGRSFIFVSQSGVGKSSMTTQLALGWALNRSDLTFGIEAIRPLRQMIAQAENDAGDLAEPAQGVVNGFGLSMGEVRRALPLIEWHEIVGESGDDFLDALEGELEARVELGEPIDVCWIDPLNNFMSGDISKIDHTKEFTGRLDLIGRRLGTIFAIIHHTGKPSKEEIKMTASDLAYSMLGSSGLTNWAREVMVLKRENVTDDEPPTFSLTATKRRKKAGMKTMTPDEDGAPMDGQTTEAIYVRHASDGTIRWEQCPKPEEPEKEEKRQQGAKSRRSRNGRRAGRPSQIEGNLKVAEAVSDCGGDGRSLSPADRRQLAKEIGVTEKALRDHFNKLGKAIDRARDERLAAEKALAEEEGKRVAEDARIDAVELAE